MIPFDASGTCRPVAGGGELRRLAVRGAGATVSAAGLTFLAQIAGTVILARLLTPADFGVVAMATTFSFLLVSFSGNGFPEAVIQCEVIDRYTASNLFWLSLAVGGVFAVAFAASGSLLARFYRNPLVANVTIGLSVGIFVSAASVIHRALLKRAMRFAADSGNLVVARTVNAVVAIVLAFTGWGYWALVAGIVAQQLSMTIGAWWLCRWVPSPPRRTGKTSSLVRFALNVYGRFSVRYGSQNTDKLLVGWQFNAAALGFYKKAYDLFALSASQLVSPLHNVALATLSRLNGDPDRFKRYLVNSLGIMAFVGMAVGADLTLVGKDIVRLVLGPQWGEAGIIFTYFGPGIGVMLLYSMVGWIHLSIGRPDRGLRWTLLEFPVMVVLFVAALGWGPKGVAVAWSASFWLLITPAFWFAGRPIRFGVSPFLGAVWKYAAAALLAGSLSAAAIERTMTFATPTSAVGALGRIVAASALFGALYLGLVVIFHRGVGPLRRLAGLLRECAPWVNSAATPAGLSRSVGHGAVDELALPVERGAN